MDKNEAGMMKTRILFGVVTHKIPCGAWDDDSVPLATVFDFTEDN